MNRKALLLVAVFVFIMLALDSLGPVRAQSNVPLVALGQPGLSFRYVETFGTTEEPYIADTVHINHPTGLFMDSSNNLYVVEEQGYRILKYNPAGTNLLSIGKAGVGYTDNYVLSNPYDIALDAGGNIWVTDQNRIIQYSPTGTFLQELPAVNPGESGNDNSHFTRARGIAIDAANHWLMVSDEQNHRIQVYDNSGSALVFSATIGENGVPGNDDSHFNEPGRIALDGNHNLFVVDAGNNRVQKCVYIGAWTCSTFVSDLNQPQGIATDGSNNVYIADTNSGSILKCTPSASCTTFEQGAYSPYDIAVDSHGNVYGAAGDEEIVTKYNNSGTYLGAFVGVLFVPYLTDGNHFNQPRVAIDKDDNIIIIEENGQRLSKLNSQGVLQWSFGIPGVSAGDNTHFEGPNGVAVDKDGNIYVADKNRVQIFSPGGSYLHTIGGYFGSGNYEFQGAAGIAVDNNGNIFVVDDSNNRVQVYNSSRIYMATLGENGVPGSDNSHFWAPSGVEVDAAGNIYVADTNNGRVQKFNSNRVYQMTFGGTTGSCTNSFADVSAEDVTVDAQGRVYVVGGGCGGNRVEVFDSSGAYLTTIGGAWGNLSSQFRDPSGVAVDSQGNIYVSDFTNARIQKFALGVPGWRQVNINGFGQVSNGSLALEVFNNQLYAATSTWSGSGACIYRSSTGTDWMPVIDPGFGDGGAVTAILDMVVFKGKLYAATGWGGGNNSVRLYRTDNGTSWDQVVSNGFEDTNNGAITVLVEYENWLYAAVQPNQNEGVEIWRSATGNLGDWSQVVSGGFHDTDIIRSFAVFNGELYAITQNSVRGDEIWRTNNGTTWEQVFTHANNNNDPFLQVFNNQLYASLRSDTLGVQLWRSSNGTDWEKVGGDGFGNPKNFRAVFFVYNGSLYAIASNNQTGFQIWHSTDGATWLKTGIDGFGDSNNDIWWEKAIAIFNGLPFIATWNGANGTEVWQYVVFPIYLPLVRK